MAYHTLMPPIVKAVAADDWSVRAVLTAPIPDWSGDIVRPDGLDFSPHESDPWVDLEHGRTDVGRRPVGWARKSLDRPGAPYALEWADLEVPGIGVCRLPVGTTYFDRDDPLQRQVYELIRRDALPGVSLEFVPIEQVQIAERSPLEPRPAYEFRRAKVLRWAHCAEPVNPSALTVLKSVPPGLEVIAKAVRDGRLGDEPLDPYLRHCLKSHLEMRQVHRSDGTTYTQRYWVSDRSESASAAAHADHPQPAAHRWERLMAGIRRAPQRLRRYATDLVRRKYQSLEAKYGPTGAKLVLAGLVLSLPVPVPGASLAPFALAEAVVRVHRWAAAHVKAAPQPLDAATLRAAIRDLYAEVSRSVPLPPLDEAALDQAVDHLLSHGVPTMPTVDEDTRLTRYDDAGDDVVPDDGDDVMSEEDGSDTVDDSAPANNGVAALYAHAQALLDAAQQLADDLKATDSPDIYQQGQELVAEVQALAERVKKLADEHDSRLQELKGETGRNELAGDMETDDAGRLKALRPVYRALLRRVRGRRRYRLEEVIKGIEAARDPLSRLSDIQKQDPEGWRKVILPRLKKLKLYGV